ncbi:MAG TPA: hypothetical protein VM925_22385 [Labilithrix sp.]|nr:hypothetical protein [Labilithrix sp.]
MADDRGAASTLKGRLADVFVRALVDGSLAELSRRLGNRATIDDPLFGRASTLSSIEPLLQKLSAHFERLGATYRHVASATGVERDVSEGVLVVNTKQGVTETPIAVVAERRRLREIELRLYYATGSEERKPRVAPRNATADVAVPQIVAHVLDGLRKGAVERVLAAFEESSRLVDPRGTPHAKRDGSLASFVSRLTGRLALVPTGAADDGRHCFVEAAVMREGDDAELAAFTFERGDSGLLREIRCYYEP